jgi:hypothetical protein
MDMKTMKRRVLIAAGLIGLPVITWALLAWEPFDRLLARFFPEMFMGEFGRFVPYTPFDALMSTILLTVYASVPIAAILLVVGVVRWVRQKWSEKTAKTVEKGTEAAVGIVYVLTGLWAVVLGIAGFAARAMANSAEDIQEKNYMDINRMAEWEPWEWAEYDWGNRRQDANHNSDKYTSFC